MIKLLILFVFSTFLFSTNAFADHVPSNGTHDIQKISLRVFKKHNSGKYLFEVASGTQHDNNVYSLVKLGSYWNFEHKQKLGVFLSSETGLRHTDDWVAINNGWEWKDTSYRSEQKIHLTYSKRFMPFERPTIFEIKNTLTHNFYNANDVYILQPSMYYFFLEGHAPKYIYNLSIPLYMPLNFEENAPYKTGIYNSIIYRYSNNYMFGISYKVVTETWTDSQDFIDNKPTENYEITDTVTTIGIEFIISL